ncbi:hypothetical protein DFS33DRAFT_1384089 [Desarmillaria ectypa]|nr:hypothetical protein DFS33DRAFT_1384089 [Desarmillaria ectypa]
MLPQELVDLIIGHLHGDIPSLQSCALTSRAFLPSSQKGIFSCVHVSSSPPSSLRGHSFENLHTLLSTYPHIAPFITSFELSFHHDSKEKEFEKILLFLPLLCNVHRFFLLSATNLIFDWNSLPVRVQDSIVAFWHASKIIDLQIEAMGHMAFGGGTCLRIGEWSSLKHLSILWSSPERLWESNDRVPFCSPQLESLTVGHFNLDLIKKSQYAGLDISFVRQFSATLENEDDDSAVLDIQYLLTQFQDTLEYLDLQMTLQITAIEFQKRYNYFDLYLCRNLRVVHIGIDMPQDLFPFTRLSPSVQEITVEVSFKSQMYPDCYKWSVIDSFIGEQDLPSLLSVKLDVHVSRDLGCSLAVCHCGADDSIDVWEVTRNMPILHSKGILRVDRKPKRTVWSTIYP